MHVIVIGGSAAGLSAALLLARDGHAVDLVDADDLDPAPDAEAAAKMAFRRGAPQLVHPHSYHPPARGILLNRLPDVYAAMRDAGAVESPPTDRLPATLVDRSDMPGDELLTTLLARRSTFDWVLRRTAAAQPGLRRIGHTRVTGLLARDGDPPRVLGVRTGQGELRADVVVDASGRRSALPRWLAEIGARTPELRSAECGLAYYTRHYRIRPGAARPGSGRLALVAFLRFLTIGAFSGDNDTLTLALCPLTGDRPLSALRYPAVHAAVARTIGPLAAWLEILDPVGDVFVLGGLHNTLRRLVVGDRPVALGLHAVGDSVCTTNPTFGRGVSLAMQGATDLVSVLAEHPDDPLAQALAMDAAVAEHVAPWYADQAATDAARAAAMRGALRGDPPVPLPDPADGVTPLHLRGAAMVDAGLYRALSSVISMVRKPSEVYGDQATVDRVRATYAAGAVPPPPSGPSRDELLAAVAGAR